MVARIYADSVEFSGPRREEWMDDSACSEKDSEKFFDKNTYHEAKKLCDGCAVRIQCLAKALVDEKGTSRRTGVFGGMGPKERELLQEQLNKMQKANATANENKEEETNHG
ncbi:WhiB family transcription factor [Microbacterium phage HitchHiker]